MSDTDETKRPKTLSLKKTETSTVKQSFSHGRTKAVVVEKKRTLGSPAPAKTPEKKAPAAEEAAPAGATTPASARPKAATPRRGPASAFGRRKSPPRRRLGRCQSFRH